MSSLPDASADAWDIPIRAQSRLFAISLAPGEAISLDHLGDIYFALNRKREASYLWKQAKDLAEPDENITESLEKKLEEYYAG